jgi:hypothetical protein
MRRGSGIVGCAGTPGRAPGGDGRAGRPRLVGSAHGRGEVVPLPLRRFVAHAEIPVLGGLIRPRPSGFGPGAGVAGASPLLTSPVPRGPMAATRRANLEPRIPDAPTAGRHLGCEPDRPAHRLTRSFDLPTVSGRVPRETHTRRMAPEARPPETSAHGTGGPSPPGWSHQADPGARRRRQRRLS